VKQEARQAAAPPPAGLFWPAWLAFAIVVLLVDLMNVQSLWRLGADGGGVGALVYEFSSGLCSIALYPLIWSAARLAYPGDGRWGRLVAIEFGASLVYSGLHIAGFVLIRIGVFALAGAHYRFGGWSALLYEYPRDLIAFGIAVGGVWGVTALLNARAASPPPQADGRQTFDIRDGQRTLRVPLADIAAVASAGNYVEFNLVDCRKPLMRATLGAIESQFAPRGFVRVHRSWLINAARVEAIEPVGSGDFTVTLTGGVKAPLSRRFREALDALRR
jgi:hypothetical protein